MTERNRIFAALTAEVSFAVLPLVVVLLVFVHIGSTQKMFASPEWTFGAAILFGQSLMKFISSLAKGGAAATGPVALIVALIVVFGLVPSLFVLNWAVHGHEQHQEMPGFLQAVQIVLFAAGTVTYMLLGTIAETWRNQKSKQVHN